MSIQGDFLTAFKRLADEYFADLAKEHADPRCVSEHDLALALLDASDRQGWDRLTWTGDRDEYAASYGYDDEGNEFDPVPPESALDFARDLLRNYEIVRKPK